MGVTSEKIQDLQEKAAEINLILLQPDVDLWKLRELALSEGGLVNGELLRKSLSLGSSLVLTLALILVLVLACDILHDTTRHHVL
mmetsp:Transcript_22323/g.62265  ORF Transcript_22323/g.62265 Transcript_22323/m.62265 type:complete len:85 (+) Transcript_22323:633-887(+)